MTKAHAAEPAATFTHCIEHHDWGVRLFCRSDEQIELLQAAAQQSGLPYEIGPCGHQCELGVLAFDVVVTWQVFVDWFLPIKERFQNSDSGPIQGHTAPEVVQMDSEAQPAEIGAGNGAEREL